MNIQFRLNGKNVQADVEPDVILLDLLRKLGCYSVKRGCETANCGLCTVWLDGKTVLSCSTLAVRVDGRHDHPYYFGLFLAASGGLMGGCACRVFFMIVRALSGSWTIRMRRILRNTWQAICAGAADICPSFGL